MVGIYKITSPSNKVYIGQSWDIKSRKKGHKHSMKRMENIRLYNSFHKYGFENHLFATIHELPEDVSQGVMDIYEGLYMSQYRGCGVELMNIKEAGSNGKQSEESKKRMSDSAKKHGHNLPIGFKHSEELKRRFSEERKGMVSPYKGMVTTTEVRQKQSMAKMGRTGGLCPNSKKIVCSKTGIVYGSIGIAAESIGIKRSTLQSYLLGVSPNKTTLNYKHG